LIVDMKRMNTILEMYPEDQMVRVGPGTDYVELNKYLKQYKLKVGPDPGMGASIGGMISTCCSGPNASKYGSMKQCVKMLKVVLPNGDVVKTRSKAHTAAGYNLTDLFIGAEGTLGLITEATISLVPIPDTTMVGRIHFATLEKACEAVIAIKQRDLSLGAVEILDDEMMKAVNSYMNKSFPELSLLLFKFVGSEKAVLHEIAVVKGICEQFTTHSFEWSKTREEIKQIWAVRKNCSWAAKALSKCKVGTDVAVPISKFADCLRRVKKEINGSILNAPIVGHASFGGFHCLVAYDPEDPAQAKEERRLNSAIVSIALSLGGTCTGEHGIGLKKKKYLYKELGTSSVNLMILLKQTLDPLNIFNPGKVVDVQNAKAKL